MKALTSPPLLPLIPDARTEPPATRPGGFESLTHPEGAKLAEIRHRAYSIWECAGRPENTALDNWLAAEAEVLAED